MKKMMMQLQRYRIVRVRFMFYLLKLL